MSAKPKVYQGVRVKITVKELLQKRRERETQKNAGDFQGSRAQFSESAPSCAGLCSGSGAVPSAPASQQSRLPENSVPTVEHLSLLDQLFLDAYLQPDPVPDTTYNVFHMPPLGATEDMMQPSPIFSQSLYPESPSDGSDLSNSFEFSPTQGISFAPQDFSSPTHQELRSCAFAHVDHYYHQANSSLFCYCAYCCAAQHQEAVRVQDAQHYPSSDCMEHLPSSTITEDFFGRESNNFDMCYI